MGLAAIVGLAGPNVSVLPYARSIFDFFVKAQDTYLFPAERPFLVLLATGFFYAGVLAIRYRNIPVTAIATNIEIHYQDADGAEVCVERKQIVRPNHPDVTAYYMTMNPSPGGILNKNEIEFWVNSLAGVIPSSTKMRGTSEGGWQCIQKFDTPLSYAWYLPLIPDRVLLFDEKYIPQFLKKYVVVRRIRAIYRNDYNRPEPYYELFAQRYPQKRITVDLYFRKERMPELDAIDARRIVVNGVISEKVERRQSGALTYYRIQVERMKREQLILSWVMP